MGMGMGVWQLGGPVRMQRRTVRLGMTVCRPVTGRRSEGEGGGGGPKGITKDAKAQGDYAHHHRSERSVAAEGLL